MKTFMVGRQPIFDSALDVYGYEILFRGPAAPVNGDHMTADVLVRVGLDTGLRGLVGDRFAFINSPRSFLVGDYEVPLPPEQTVLEVLEDVPADSDVITGCRRLKRRGYMLALDDYVGSPDSDPLLEVVDMVKLDVLAIPSDDLARCVEHCSRFGVRLLAEKVETQEDLETCKRLGIDLFQGYLLSRPQVVTRRDLPAGRVACLQIIDRLCDPGARADELQRLVETDAGLSHRFLRAAGTGMGHGLRHQVGSIREGVVMLGFRGLRNWITLMLLTDAKGGASESVTIGMTRARMCELMASELAPSRRDSAFTAGLVSSLDLLLDMPLSDVVDTLSITDELIEAVMSHSGPLGTIVGDVLAWEMGGYDLKPKSGMGLDSIEQCYLEALSWAIDLTSPEVAAAPRREPQTLTAG